MPSLPWFWGHLELALLFFIFTASFGNNPIQASAAASTGAMDCAQPLAGSQDAETPRYERVVIGTQDDLTRLYSVVRAYALNPALAETVKDVYIDTDKWVSPVYFRSSLAIAESVNEVDVQAHDEPQKALMHHVSTLGLEDDMQAEILEALDNERRIAIGAWTLPGNKRDKFREKFGYAIAALLISFCVNIESLSLGKLYSDNVLHQYLRMANYGLLSQPALQNLKSATVLGFELDSRSYSHVEIFQCLQYFHRLPGIDTIRMDGVEEYQMEYHHYIPRMGSMRRIELTHASITSRALAKLIFIPKALEELKVSFGGLWTGDGGNPMVEYGGVSNALLDHAATLRVLDMDYECSIGRFPAYNYNADDDIFVGVGDERSDDEWMTTEHRSEYQQRQQDAYGLAYAQMDQKIAWPSNINYYTRPTLRKSHIAIFREMKVLTHLSISITAVVSPVESERLVDSLPTSLEYLCLYGYTRGKYQVIDSNIDELVSKMAEKLPNLKEVKGINETVQSLYQIHGTEPKEDDLYDKPSGTFCVLYDGEGWTEASS